MLTKFMASEDAFQIVFTMIFFGALGVFHGLRAFKNKRKIEDTACSKISSAAQGLAEIQGNAWPTISLKSVDGRPICYWHIEVQKYQRRGRSSEWVTVYKKETADPIILTDGTGACLVVPEKADVHALSETYYVHKMTAEQRDYLMDVLPEASEHFSMVGKIFVSLFGGDVRVKEKKIVAGGPMYVRGDFSTQLGSMVTAVGDYTGYYSQHKKFQDIAYQKRMFDADRDGRISEKELINGHFFSAHPFVRREETQRIEMNGHLTWSSIHGLIIADIYQSYLAKRLFYLSTFILWGGAALVGLGFFLLSKKF